MKKTQFQTLVVSDFETNDFPYPTHSHTYYEMIYIRKGFGIHLINDLKFNYKAGDLFIISPEDEHYFDIKKSTHFTFIKFTDNYFSSHKHNQPDSMMLISPELIMRNRYLKEVKLILDEPCLSILKNTVENIVAYNCRKDLTTSPLIFYQILSIFGLIKEAATKLNIRIAEGNPDKEELINYIHQNIYNPSLLQIKSISSIFNISPTYFSDYFKRNFSMNFRQYVDQYRIQLIEKRIQSPKMTMKQIADEFGFTDESHLSHFFKSKRKISPSEFRKTTLN